MQPYKKNCNDLNSLYTISIYKKWFGMDYYGKSRGWEQKLVSTYYISSAIFLKQKASHVHLQAFIVGT